MRVLVVDDDPLVRRSLGRLLRMHAVALAKDGNEALALIRSGTTFDAILCDLNMPGMSGRTLHATIEALLPELARRIVFMSGGALSSSDNAFLAAHRSLQKPFTQRDLEALLE